RFTQEEQQQLQSTFLTTGQFAHPGRKVFPAEPETFQKLGRGMVFAVNIKRCFRIRQDLTNTVGPNFFQLGELLVQHTDPNRLTVLNTTLGRLDISRHQTKQCGFPGTVGTENAGPLPRPEKPCDIAQHLAVAKAHTDIFNVNNILAKTGNGKSLEFNSVTYRWNVFDHLVCRINAEFWLGCSGRGTTAQPGQFLT